MRAFVLSLTVFVLASSSASAQFKPDFNLKPDDYTVLMAVDAKASPGLGSFQSGSHGKFFVHGWNQPDQKLEWNIQVPRGDPYAANILIQRIRGLELRLDLTVDGKVFSATLPADASHWQRVPIGSVIPFTAGPHDVSLAIQAATGGSFEVKVHAVELVRPSVKKSLHETALRIRKHADTTRFQDARYGMMVHWTKQSMPLKGDPKSYEQAVADFDVEAFADTMKSTGAGFVVFTTSHAMQYFPAPLKSLDAIIPGRPTPRDLPAELAAALAKRSMKLFLYFHLGAHDDAAWLKASGFWETDTTRFFNNWESIISEAGERYGDKLAGWWFDDGSTNYYYRSAPWESLVRAAKAGNPRRLVGFNAWELNNPTQFHDYFTGEGFHDPRGFGELLTPECNGVYPSGTHTGLQASACLMADATWVHASRDTPPSGPRWNADQLTELLKGFIAHKNVPIFNLEITQDGHLSPESIAVFTKAAAGLK